MLGTLLAVPPGNLIHSSIISSRRSSSNDQRPHRHHHRRNPRQKRPQHCRGRFAQHPHGIDRCLCDLHRRFAGTGRQHCRQHRKHGACAHGRTSGCHRRPHQRPMDRNGLRQCDGAHFPARNARVLRSRAPLGRCGHHTKLPTSTNSDFITHAPAPAEREQNGHQCQLPNLPRNRRCPNSTSRGCILPSSL